MGSRCKTYPNHACGVEHVGLVIELVLVLRKVSAAGVFKSDAHEAYNIGLKRNTMAPMRQS